MRRRAVSGHDESTFDEEPKQRRATEEILSLGPVTAGVSLLRQLLPLLALWQIVLAPSTESGRYTFWHCLPFASAALAVLIVSFATQKKKNEDPIKPTTKRNIDTVAVAVVHFVVLGCGMSRGIEYDLQPLSSPLLARSIAIGLVGAVVHVWWPTVCVAVNILESAVPPTPRISPHGLPKGRRWIHDNPSVAVLKIINNMILVPLVDEIFFRCFMHHWLAPSYGEPGAWGITSILWAALHCHYPGEWIYTAMFGIALQSLVVSNPAENVSGAVTAHVVRNTVLNLYAVITRSWYLLDH
eukprot:m.44460 g.44460  ORF g.44460 m.44460 type:complete len:298 (-) comp19684_c0_seq1:93-986(-)